MTQVNKAITDTKIQVEPIYKAQSDAFGFFDYPFLIDMINKNNVSRILDVGTGEGSFLIGLAQRTKNIQFDGIDLNENLVEIGKFNNKQLGLNINFSHANFGESYAESNYDLIIARFAVEHIKNFKDIDFFIATTYEKLKASGWLIIIEYYVHALDVDDVTWMRFRESEAATYESAQAHPRIALKLPESLKKAKFKNIKSTLNHISPSTIGEENFFNLVREYTKLYSQIAPEFWTRELTDQVITWCNKKHYKGEPTLFTSYTVGQKTEA
jgi:ubiquinone/menaquinone biosynthesis C-methylase UbiE